MPVAAVAAVSTRAAGVLSFSFVFGSRFRRLRSSATPTGFIRSGMGFRTASGVGMLRFLDPALGNNAAVAAVLDTARIADFGVSERRNASKCQQSQH
jgi:hypothetical protein